MFAHVPLVRTYAGPEGGGQFTEPAVGEVEGRQVLVERGVHAGRVYHRRRLTRRSAPVA